MINDGPVNFKDILKNKQALKPPAHPWQDLALRIIDELGIPSFKRNSVFKVCKELPRPMVEKALNDTKELVKDGENWKYFFKIIGTIQNKKTAFEPKNSPKNK
ncbi:MAG: hypothetical protein HUU49_02055 [Candidatus Buchananbacteria bacterium]|nr:hypothetical protein [Candidatus Buchananbacteria bacterium]